MWWHPASPYAAALVLQWVKAVAAFLGLVLLFCVYVVRGGKE